MAKMDTVEIKRVEDETPSIRSLYFEWAGDVKPGQFIMVWIPGIDEVPMALSRHEPIQSITVKRRGQATEHLHEMEPGDKIGLRGGYGTGYSLEGEEILAVIGGIGGASVRPAIAKAVREGKNVRCAMGCLTSKELLFKEELSEITDLQIATDDGSEGHHGFVTELAEETMDNEDIDTVLTCGPEVMMTKIVDMAVDRDIEVQASLERYMKCGLGLCDSCSINGYQVCEDGPVFSGEQLKDMDEFGKYERDKAGRKESLK